MKKKLARNLTRMFVFRLCESSSPTVSSQLLLWQITQHILNFDPGLKDISHRRRCGSARMAKHLAQLVQACKLPKTLQIQHQWTLEQSPTSRESPRQVQRIPKRINRSHRFLNRMSLRLDLARTKMPKERVKEKAKMPTTTPQNPKVIHVLFAGSKVTMKTPAGTKPKGKLRQKVMAKEKLQESMMQSRLHRLSAVTLDRV